MRINIFFNYCLLFAVCCFLQGCGEPLMKYDINTDTPVVESYLQEGDNSVTVKVYSMEEYLKNDIKLSKPISQLNPTINNNELTETSSGEYHLDLGTDTIREGQKFSLQFDYNGKSIEASTTVPAPVHSLTVEPQSLELSSSSYFDFSDTTHVLVSWDDPDNNYYQLYIVSPSSQNMPNFGMFNHRVMQPFKGNSYRINAGEFRVAGTHTIYVYRVNADYAEMYDFVSASDLANPVSYINNAFGIFTSMSSAKINVTVYNASE